MLDKNEESNSPVTSSVCPRGSDRSQMTSIKYRKIPKISPSTYKPLQIQGPQTGNEKNPPLNRPSKYKPHGGLCLENCPQIQSKTKKSGKFPSNYKASPIDFETQSLAPGLWNFKVYGCGTVEPPRYRYLSTTDRFQCPDKILIYFF